MRRHERHTARLVVIRMLALERTGNGCHSRPRLVQRHARLQTAHPDHPDGLPVGEQFLRSSGRERVNREGKEQIRLGDGVAREAGRADANRRERTVDVNRATDDVGRAVKSQLPESMAENGDLLGRARAVFRWKEAAPERHRHAENIEVVARHREAKHALRTIATSETHWLGTETTAGKAGKHLVPIAIVGVVRIRHVVESFAACGPSDIHQGGGIANARPLPQQQGVGEAEDGGIRRDADRQRQDGRRRKTWRVPQHT